MKSEVTFICLLLVGGEYEYSHDVIGKANSHCVIRT